MEQKNAPTAPKTDNNDVSGLLDKTRQRLMKRGPVAVGGVGGGAFKSSPSRDDVTTQTGLHSLSSP